MTLQIFSFSWDLLLQLWLSMYSSGFRFKSCIIIIKHIYLDHVLHICVQNVKQCKLLIFLWRRRSRKKWYFAIFLCNLLTPRVLTPIYGVVFFVEYLFLLFILTRRYVNAAPVVSNDDIRWISAIKAFVRWIIH